MLDESAIRRLKEWGGPTLALKMIRLFLDTSHERVDQVREGLEGSGLELAERGAHSLKSSAANLGATQLQEMSDQMETLLSQGDAAGATALYDAFEEAHDAAIAGLREMETTLS